MSSDSVAVALLDELVWTGARVEADGDRLRITIPPGKMTPDLESRIKQSKIPLARLVTEHRPGTFAGSGGGGDRELRDRAAREGCSIVAWFSDEAVSGDTSTGQRPGRVVATAGYSPTAWTEGYSTRRGSSSAGWPRGNASDCPGTWFGPCLAPTRPWAGKSSAGWPRESSADGNRCRSGEPGSSNRIGWLAAWSIFATPGLLTFA
jgi:hypothetical protein